MATYKLLALDMDGTLLDSRKGVLPETKAAIEQLAARGVAIAYSTGRGPIELSDYINELPAIRYGSCISGAVVYDIAGGRALYTQPLSTDLALKILDAGAREGAMVHILSVDASVVREADLRHMDDFHMGVYHDMFSRLCLHGVDPQAYVRENPGEICKINLYHRDTASRQRSRERLAGLPLQLADAETTSLECSPAGVSKAKGLAKLCDYLGISLNEVVAVGDAPQRYAGPGSSRPRRCHGQRDARHQSLSRCRGGRQRPQRHRRGYPPLLLK